MIFEKHEVYAAEFTLTLIVLALMVGGVVTLVGRVFGWW